MAITVTSYPERILIVLNPDGSLKGAHQERLETIVDGETVINAKQLGAEPLDEAALVAVLPDQAALAAQVQSLTDQVAALEAAKADLEGQLGQQGGPIVSVTPYQARVALYNAGLIPAVEALMAHPETDPLAKIAWEYATTIERNSPFIVALAPALGLTEQQIDDLFTTAAAI